MLQIRPVKQLRPGFCGPAALKTFLSFFKVKCSQKKLAKLCNTTAETGTKPENLAKALKFFGFRAVYGEYGNHGLLNFYVNCEKIPVLVAWWAGKDEHSDGHYSVVCGIDEKNIWIADPAEGKVLKRKWVDFQRNWFEFEGDALMDKKDLSLRWWLVACKKGETR